MCCQDLLEAPHRLEPQGKFIIYGILGCWKIATLIKKIVFTQIPKNAQQMGICFGRNDQKREGEMAEFQKFYFIVFIDIKKKKSGTIVK